MPVELVQCKTAASQSRLPGLDWAVNPYRGCGHACAYCYAQDVTRFEQSKPWGEVIEVKVNIVQRLKKELVNGAKGVYGVGTVTDPYQSLEKKFELTRGCLAVLRNAGVEASILTKSDLVLRDVDILKGWTDVEVGVSLASLNGDVSSLLEPGAPSPEKRLDALKSLSDEGVRTYLMAAPIVRGLSDSEDDLRALVRRAGHSGVSVVMWDKFNPKPMATSRLRRRLAEKGFGEPGSHSRDEVSRIRSILESECASAKIELLDAF
jgi:DNA repair photolyase